MGVGLQPLEFTECLADSPAFRDNLQRHEKELDRTSQQIKRLIKEVKDVVQAARRLGAAQLALAASMEQFEFATIGASQTEDERVIGRSLATFAALIRTVEDERDRMLGRANEQIIQPLERFRKEHIGAVKEGKKKFDKKTAKFCATQERTLSLSVRKGDAALVEADAALEMASRDFCQASLEYVFQLQAVQERKKFELVEPLLGFVFGWWTFHHTAHDVHHDNEPRVRDLQLRIQRTRTNFEETSKQTESLMKKMMEMRQMRADENVEDGGGSRAGYLFLMEKKAFGTTWSKQWAQYEGAARRLQLLPYSQLSARAAPAPAAADTVELAGARAAPEPPDRRFCWEALPADHDRAPLLLQALGDRDKDAWIRVIVNSNGGSLPANHRSAALPSGPANSGSGGGGGGGGGARLDAAGFEFVRRVIAALEARGLDDQGLYRVAGQASKVSRLVSAAEDPRRLPPHSELSDPTQWESKTLTSALKSYFRALPDRLLPRALTRRLVAAAQLERPARVVALRRLLRDLPPSNHAMLLILLQHLRNVARCSARNLMPAGNLAVCWGPTLVGGGDSVASILELKFANVLLETLLDHYHDIFDDQPPPPPPAPPSVDQPPPASLSAVSTHSLNGIGGASPTCGERPGAGGGVTSARYSPHQHQLLHQLCAPPPPAMTSLPPAAYLRAAAHDSSSSAESVSSQSPPLVTQRAAPFTAPLVAPGRWGRARTLYACLGESEGELSFEPNQILTNVAPSPEPGWLRGTLNGRTGLVPENYVEPLP